MDHSEKNRIINLDEKKSEAIINYKDNNGYIEGTKRICEKCQNECLGKLYCEYCFRKFLRSNFSKWTSGSDKIDNLIRKCQMESITPNRIIEWIPYDHFQNIKYLTNSRYSEIFTAKWIGGSYNKWDSEKQELRRYGTRDVILKKSNNFKSVEQSFFEEATLLLSMSSKWRNLVKCFGITQDPLTENYMLVMKQMDIDLRKYLQKYHNQLTWRERINIVYIIIYALSIIHKENTIHGDLHSGNILYKEYYNSWYIGDIALRGPVNKPVESIYGNLPYIAPEVIAGKDYTVESDIYSIAMLMWEISSGQPPFNNYEHDFDVTMKIINGIRPKIVPETPLEYKKLMQQCWDADPSNRPDGNTLKSKIEELKAMYKNDNQKAINQELKSQNPSIINQSNKDLKDNQIGNTSKIYIFKNLPEPKNATEDEQEDDEGNIYNNPNLHSEDQDELEIPEIDDMSELYNKGTSDFNSNMEEKEQVESNNDIESENQTNEIQTNGNTNEIQTNKIQTNEIQTNEIQTNYNQIYENQTNENYFKVPEDEEKKSKNKKNFVGTVKGSINKISKFVKSNLDKKDKKFDKNDKNDNKGQFQKQEYDNGKVS
ncbi:kinase-like protein [Rhizophagus irregularis]|nr:kinase-like protein [Rhizophagus irregularis]